MIDNKNPMNIETFLSTAIIEELSKKLPSKIEELSLCIVFFNRKYQKYNSNINKQFWKCFSK